MEKANYYSVSRVRTGLRHFALGRSFNGLGGLIFLFLSVRGLTAVEYGNYIVFLAGIELLSLGSSVGVFGFTQRYLPEFRIKGSPRLILNSLGVCLGVRLLTLAACALLILAAAEPIAGLLDISVSHAGFVLFAAWLAVEGTCRWLDNVTESLLLQGVTQVSILLRTWPKVVAVAILAFHSELSLERLLACELLGSCLAVAVVLCCLYAIVAKSPAAADRSYRPNWKAIVAFSRQHYAALVLGQMYGYNTLKLLLSAIAGASATAVYGFAQSLVDIVRRYLPVQLLLGLVRPLIIASYADGNDVRRPIFLSNLVFKLNVFVTAPIIAAAVPYASHVAALVDRGRYPGAYPLIIAFMFILVLQTLHVVLVMLAMSLEQATLILRATFVAILGIAVAGLLIPQIGALGAIAGALVSELGYCWAVAAGIRKRHRTSVIDSEGHLRIWVLAACAAACAWLVTTALGFRGELIAVAGPALVMGLYFVLARYWRPFSAEERNTLNRVLPRAVFVW